MGLLATLASLLLFISTQASYWTRPVSFAQSRDRKPSSGSLGAVTSGVARCSKIGIDVFADGGNAADAAIATQFCLGVTRPDLTGIGGGGFALIRERNRNHTFLNFREAAPGAASQSMYKNGSLPGGLAVGVPGELRGLEYIHRHYGSLPWRRLVRPAATLAIEGFSMGHDLNEQIIYLDSPDFLSKSPSWALDFAPNGTVLTTNQTLKRERYGRLLNTIAEGGAHEFYRGAIAESMVRAVHAAGGILSLEDLQNYHLDVQHPLEITYHQYRVFSGRAPSGGPVALSALKVVEGFAGFGKATNVNLSAHRFDETLRFAFGERTNLADPKFIKGMEAYEQRMIEETTASKIRAKISDDHTLPIADYNPDGYQTVPTPGTSNLEAADQQGLVISLTSTVDSAFGSRIMVPETGIVLNDEMNDFSVPNDSETFGSIPCPNNLIEPGKRPLSSITTIIVEDAKTGRFHVALGGAGGTRIITTVTQALLHVLNGWTPLQAIKASRLHDQLDPNEVSLEIDYDNGTAAYLASKGHNVSRIGWRQSDVHVIKLQNNGTFDAVAETSLWESGAYTV